MHHFFSEDSPAFAVLSFFTDMVIVSVLWLVCCLPVFTVGAAFSALYYAVTKALRYKRGYAAREFFRGLKMCFRQSTAAWLLYVLLMAVLMIDLRIMQVSGGNTASFLQFVFTVIMLCLTVLLIYMLAYIARFTLPFGGVIRNAALMAVRHLPWSVILILLIVCPAAGVCLVPPLILIMPAAAAFLDSLILERIFRRYMTDEALRLEEARNHPEQYDNTNDFK